MVVGRGYQAVIYRCSVPWVREPAQRWSRRRAQCCEQHHVWWFLGVASNRIRQAGRPRLTLVRAHAFLLEPEQQRHQQRRANGLDGAGRGGGWGAGRVSWTAATCAENARMLWVHGPSLRPCSTCQPK
jgi:hypothetical protein